MASESTLRFSAQTDEVTSLLRIVNMVRTGEASTRPEIGRITGLGRGVVTQRIDQAIDMGFLADSDLAPSTGGRAARTLRFRAEQGRILVCALGALHIRVGLADLDGTLLAHTHENWEISRGPEETLARTVDLAKALRADDSTPIWAVAVGLPGPVDFATGRPVAPPIMPGWNGFDVRGVFEDEFDAPAWIDNDVNLLVFGERARRGSVNDDLIYCKVGSGIGAGLLSHGRTHRGNNGAAGDIGHVRVNGSDEPCRCGKTGCLEAVAGGWALVRDAHRALEAGETGQLAAVLAAGETLTPEAIARSAENGDSLSIRLIQHSARMVGEAAATLVNVFNPKSFIIGGAAAAAGELYLAEVRQRVYELSLPLATRDLRIVNSVNDAQEPLRGGAALAVEELFESTFPRWFSEGRPSPRVTDPTREPVPLS